MKSKRAKCELLGLKGLHLARHLSHTPLNLIGRQALPRPCPRSLALVGGEDDDERAREPARVKRVDLSHNSLQWRLARRARRQPLQLPQCLLTACRRRRCGSAILGKWSDRSAQVLSAASAAGATYLLRCTITRRSREAGGERRRDAERGGKCSFFLSL